MRRVRNQVPGLAIAAVVVSAFLVLGLLSGVVWEALWTPPHGLVSDGSWALDRTGVAEEFGATGTYVLIALAVGLVSGAVAALVSPGRDLVTLAAVLVGAVAAALLMAQTGHALGPPDPRLLAAGQTGLTTLPADLRLRAPGAYAVLPAAATTGLLLVWWGVRERPTRRGRGR